MESSIIEAAYSIMFHKEEAILLGEHLKNRHNVVLIGMKRVGISNFLRFFLYHKDISKTYIKDGKHHLFITVDLNDLVEREIGPFWTLTLKRIVDYVGKAEVSAKAKKEIESLFLNSIQTQDLFLTIDNVRKSLLILVENNILPTVFFVLFDRLKDAVTPEFFANIQGVLDATNRKACCVFTSYRPLDMVAPDVFPRSTLMVFSHDMFIRPVIEQDARIIADTYKKSYNLLLPDEAEQTLFKQVDGYVRYLHLALVILYEKKDRLPQTEPELTELLHKDERIFLQSEELWESLTPSEQDVLLKVFRKKQITTADEQEGKYLFQTGFISRSGTSLFIFSPLFEHFLRSKEKASYNSQSVEFTKKEHLLFNSLKNHVNEICERESIIAAVWPEVEALGVSDWAIDRLVARVRNKLKLQKSTFEIHTIKTRGYKLISS